ncbi:hypothetical protein YC2023_028382 [Brassica napus]
MRWAEEASAKALDFSGTFFEGGLGSDDDPTSPSVSTALEDKPEPQCLKMSALVSPRSTKR